MEENSGQVSNFLAATCRRSSILNFSLPYKTGSHVNIWPNSTPLRDTMLQNLSDLHFDLSMSLRGKFDSVIGLFLYAFLLMFNSNIWHNSAPSRDIRLRNLSELDFVLSRSPKVKCDGVIGLPIYAINV